jgi:hypothetical protein
MDINKELWGKYIAGIEAMAGNGPEGSQLQVFGAPVPFEWGIKTGNKNPLEYWNFCNQLPVWNSVGSYTPMGGSLVSSYESFLDKIKQDYSQELKNQITTAQEKLAADTDQLVTFTTTTSAAYKQYADNQEKFKQTADPIDTWMKDTGRDLQHKSLLAMAQKDNDIIESLLAQENRQYANAWAGFNNVEYKRMYTDASSNVQTKRIYAWSDNPVDMTQKLRAGTLAHAQTIKFSETSQSYDFSKSWAQGSAALNFIFFSIGGGGSWEKMNTEESFKDLNVSIAFKNFSLVTINPETGWFDDGYLTTQANGPYVDDNTVGFANQATGNQTYFFGGAKAILPGMVTGILVGYQPSFKLTTNESAFSDVYESAQGSGGIGIGPFHFGGGGGHTSKITKSSSSSNTIECSDTSDVPQIFGIYLKVMP